ncbi:4-hydroxyphenylacetate decarboxylase small subunit [Clostridium sp. ATCC 25772]|uniref:4-hydroxyphenylacetate decarboxylase small subunit n=1 Tax=Clostridium sp. ATCC 25772 TaxID=1676991 RepID=UPI0007832C9F|nr:4-hydroxyphenylacetate decarboxylase small subunit [Clostridium sp. ATCC 25772]
MLYHGECKNFCNVDASKGICRISKKFVSIDEEGCNKFELTPKCGNCINFKNEDKKGIGLCTGLEKENWSFKTLNAITCKKHEFNE